MRGPRRRAQPIPRRKAFDMLWQHLQGHCQVPRELRRAVSRGLIEIGRPGILYAVQQKQKLVSESESGSIFHNKTLRDIMRWNLHRCSMPESGGVLVWVVGGRLCGWGRGRVEMEHYFVSRSNQGSPWVQGSSFDVGVWAPTVLLDSMSVLKFGKSSCRNLDP